MNLRRRAARLVAVFRQSPLDRELDAEIAAHLELAEHEARRHGLDPVAARQQALRAFGGIDQMKELHRDAKIARQGNFELMGEMESGYREIDETHGVLREMAQEKRGLAPRHGG